MTELQFVAWVRESSSVVLRMALDQVQTVAGAERIWCAEWDGQRRVDVLRGAERRIEQLGGAERVQSLVTHVARVAALVPA